ncbi:hypothetical protein [Pedobacter sandarakinus]|uniref:hypothetical protein n=1 Tax=Pedobacter sandarakinus TaxID=353156 RepID=UPI0022453D62|nr:hypothetical protein [Pedobacter sandarakinus]MCX2576143.1 hypothetical protein [Pedobacter sandarakinus]
MKKAIILALSICASIQALAQTGIGTGSPLSTLHNTGSFAGNYVNPGVTYTLDNDYVVDFTASTANTVYTLPSISEGNAAGRNGRTYLIRNGAVGSNAITVKASGSETINSGTANSNTILLYPGHAVTIIRNATPPGGTNNTWNILSYSDLGGVLDVSGKTVSGTYGFGVPASSSTNSPASASTMFGAFGNKLLSNDFNIQSPRTVTFTFRAGIDDSSSDQSSHPIVHFYLEIYNTITNAVVAGSGPNSSLGTVVEMISGQNTSFTLMDDIALPAGTYNARMKVYYVSNFPTQNGNFHFVSYSMDPSYLR